jgi:hypothetical protein
MDTDPSPGADRHRVYDRAMHRPLMRPVVTAAIVALIVAACGSSTPSASPSSPPSSSPSASAPAASPSASASGGDTAVYAEINEQVRAIRGLQEKQPIEPTIVSPDEMTQVLKDSFSEDYPPEQVAADEQLYHGLGLLPKEDKLADLYIDLLSSQVAGLYDPIKKKLYVVSKEGGVGAVEQVYYSHEYDHVLQDQNFDLQKIQDGLDDKTDEALARQSLVEGDAYLTMSYWLQQNLTPEEIGEVIQASNDPTAQQALNRIPPIVQAQITFSAIQGTQFVTGVQLGGGWEAVNSGFGDPPKSTEQILHADKYASHEAPIAVDLPADLAKRMGSGWSTVMSDTMGEHQTAIWLGSGTVAAATDASAGWGGDRITYLSGPRDSWAISWHTVWDSKSDASEFDVTAKTAVENAGGPGQVLPGEGGTTRWVVIGSDDAVLQKVANVLGLAG